MDDTPAEPWQADENNDSANPSDSEEQEVKAVEDQVTVEDDEPEAKDDEPTERPKWAPKPRVHPNVTSHKGQSCMHKFETWHTQLKQGSKALTIK